MSDKNQLRVQRTNTVINGKSKLEDIQCETVIKAINENFEKEFNVTLQWQKQLYFVEIVETLKKAFPDVEFATPGTKSHMKPDGGITYIVDKKGNRYPLLIAEVKNQGTNDARAKEGLKKQPMGNAVERLGKNVIALRTYMMTENIFPFVCFGDGCDFEEGSTILDRVSAIGMFGTLNADHTANVGPNGVFGRGSYYFRNQSWTAEEVYNIMYDVAKRAMYYYFSKYGEESFK